MIAAIKWGVFLLLAITAFTESAEDFFHQAPDQFKLSPGWQEPGFWRPKFIMERVFTSPDGTVESTDRVYFKLKPDRTMKIFRSTGRPFLEIFKKTTEVEKKKKLFEAGSEESEAFKKQFSESYFEIDGTWWWQDAAPLNQGKVKLETREGRKGEMERIRHDVRCDWGTLDSYVPKFREGKLLKYKTEAGIPVGTYPAGTFTIKVSPHRPLVSKEYLAFQ
jgi:hypothetical protein